MRQVRNVSVDRGSQQEANSISPSAWFIGVTYLCRALRACDTGPFAPASTLAMTGTGHHRSCRHEKIRFAPQTLKAMTTVSTALFLVGFSV